MGNWLSQREPAVTQHQWSASDLPGHLLDERGVIREEGWLERTSRVIIEVLEPRFILHGTCVQVIVQLKY